MAFYIPLLERARVFATAAHAAVGQTRKYDGRPYIEHPIRVFDILNRNIDDCPLVVLAAAILHDVLEDTKVTDQLLQEEFGDEVTQLVLGLTNISRPEDGNRAARKKKDRDFLATQGECVQTIKVADLIDNTSDIVKNDPKFAKVYVQEKKELLDVLTRADARLLSIARQQLKDAEAILGAV